MAKELTLAELANLSAPSNAVLELPILAGPGEGGVVGVHLREPRVKETLAMRSDFMGAGTNSGRIDGVVRKWFKTLASGTDEQYVALVKSTGADGFGKLSETLLGMAGFEPGDEEGDGDASDDASFPAGP